MFGHLAAPLIVFTVGNSIRLGSGGSTFINLAQFCKATEAQFCKATEAYQNYYRCVENTHEF